MKTSGLPKLPPEIVLDLSRLLSRIHHRTPTGVDRVEMAYARSLLDRIPERLAFGAVHPLGVYGRIPNDAARAFIAETAAGWNDPMRQRSGTFARGAALAGPLLRLRPRPIPAPQRPRVLIQSSPNHLHQAGRVRSKLRRERARYICLIHDLIPIEYPEYARGGGAALHHKRMTTVADLADGIIANSAATRSSFLSYLQASGRSPPIETAHLGLDEAARFGRGTSMMQVGTTDERRPYFVCLGTIEPRKNHLLLLHAWRRLAEKYGAETSPRLLVIGRRGWENEQVIDLLERCPALNGCVAEIGGMSDVELRRTIAGARALLLPSFAEGYGMPVPEAIAVGVPVLCSDLPALREAGGNVPDYLDPLDGLGWMEAILDYAAPDSKRRRAQIDRMAGWKPPSWDEHIDIVLAMAEQVA